MSIHTTCIDVADDIERKVCAICIEDMLHVEGGDDAEADVENTDNNVCTLKCGHQFHLACITPVVVNSFLGRRDLLCPLCRNVECCTSTLTYQAAYNSLVDMVRQEGREELLVDVRIDIQQLESLSPARNLPPTTPQHVVVATDYRYAFRYCMASFWLGNIAFLAIGLIIMAIYVVKSNMPS